MDWTTNQSLLRDRIIGKAQDGSWTDKQAEKVAGRLGVGPLKSTPDLAGYDPLQETYWSILMTLAWIMWRDADHVREFWDDWRTKCIEWSFLEARMPGREEVKSWRLESRKTASLLSLVVEESYERAHGNPPLIAESDAERELWRHLQLGTVPATGSGPIRLKRRSPIPAESWQDLKLKEEGDRVLIVDSFGMEAWKDVTVPGEAVQLLWPVATLDSGRNADNDQKSPSQPNEADVKLGTTSPFEETSELPIMYLGAVLYWVASKGQTVPVSDYNEDWLKVRAKIVAGKLAVTGLNMRTNQFEPILGSNFSAAVVTTDPKPHEFLFSPIDEGHGSIGGTLYPPGETEPLWIQIQCQKMDVRKAWPFSSKSDDNNTRRPPSTSPKNRERQRSSEENARLKVKYESILAAGRSLRKRNPTLGPDELAALMDKEKRQDLSTETVGQILSSRYKAMKRFGLKGIF